jgi:hypothetical protein
MEEQFRQQFLRSSPEELEKIVQSYGPDRKEGAFCLMLLQSKRQKAIEDRLDALRTPHWTLTPTFWCVVIGVIASIVAALITWLSWEHPHAAPDSMPITSPTATP